MLKMLFFILDFAAFSGVGSKIRPRPIPNLRNYWLHLKHQEQLYPVLKEVWFSALKFEDPDFCFCSFFSLVQPVRELFPA